MADRRRHLRKASPAEGFLARSEAALTFARDIDRCAGLYAAAAIVPAERNVHQDVEDPECLAAFWRTVDHGQAFARQEALDQIRRLSAGLDVLEADRLKTRLGFAVCGGLGEGITRHCAPRVRGRALAAPARGVPGAREVLGRGARPRRGRHRAATGSDIAGGGRASEGTSRCTRRAANGADYARSGSGSASDIAAR